jgi:hypothetical protein
LNTRSDHQEIIFNLLVTLGEDVIVVRVYLYNLIGEDGEGGGSERGKLTPGALFVVQAATY